ncbi:MAG: endonuclease/exonuclease/phosphatase family protein [Elusimicrobia bacterium]|nr:endonuclease/exonuclease/phosphatase family protein [Elusimicrobiota bacterium]
MCRVLLAFLSALSPVYASAREPGQYRVATFNLFHDFPYYSHIEERLDLVVPAVSSHDIDVLAVQEGSETLAFDNSVEQLARRLGYSHAYFRLEGMDSIYFFNGLGIISRFPIVDTELYQFQAQASELEKRSAARAVIRSADHSFSVYVAHLSGESRELNLAQAQELIRFVERSRGNRPAVLMGDLNAQPDWSSIRLLKREGFIDADETAQGRDRPTCCVCIFPEHKNPRDSCPGPDDSLKDKIDYVFLGPHPAGRAAVLSSSLILDRAIRTGDVELRASDHLGVMALLKLF